MSNPRPALRVGACRPGFPPFVDDDGTGFDIDLWNATWYELKARVTGNAVKEAIVGESPPEIEFLPANQMLDKIRADELDVAMCGIYGSQDLYHSMDFGPVYHSSEVGTLVKMPSLPMGKDEVGLLLVLKAAFSNLDSWAVFSFIVLLYFTMVFAHIFWILERNHNPMVNRHYGDGVWKGMYFGMVTATTVGYGDIVPKTRVGKLVTAIWIFCGTFAAALFTAAMTSSLVNSNLGLSLIGDDKVTHISDLGLVDPAKYFEPTFKVATNFQGGADAIHSMFPILPPVHIYQSPTESYKALMDGTCDALMEDVYRIKQLTTNQNHSYFGKFVALSDKDIADRDKDKRTGRLVWVISRISNRFRNPIMADVYNSQREVMYGVHEFEHKERVEKYLGSQSAPSLDEIITKSEEVVKEGLVGINWVLGMTLLGIMLSWTALILCNYRKEILQQSMQDGLRVNLQIGRSFTKKELRQRCDRLFDELDGNGNGFLEPEELVQFLQRVGRQFEIPDLYRFLGRAHEIDEERQQGKAAHVHSLRKDIQNSLSFRKRQQNLQKLSIGKQEFFDIVRMILLGEEGEKDHELHHPVTGGQLLHSAEEIKYQLQDMERRILSAVHTEIAHLVQAAAEVNGSRPHKGSDSSTPRPDSPFGATLPLHSPQGSWSGRGSLAGLQVLDAQVGYVSPAPPGHQVGPPTPNANPAPRPGNGPASSGTDHIGRTGSGDLHTAILHPMV